MSEANVSKFVSRADREEDRAVSKFAEGTAHIMMGCIPKLDRGWASDELHKHREMTFDCDCYWDTYKRVLAALQELLPRIIRAAGDPLWQYREGIETGDLDWLGFKILDWDQFNDIKARVDKHAEETAKS